MSGDQMGFLTPEPVLYHGHATGFAQFGAGQSERSERVELCYGKCDDVYDSLQDIEAIHRINDAVLVHIGIGACCIVQ